MSRIFLSFCLEDEKPARTFAKMLEEYEHQIIFDEASLKPSENFQEKLLTSMEEADGTIVLLTNNGLQSDFLMRQFQLILTHHESNSENKFLIPLISDYENIPKGLDYLNFIPFKIDSLFDTIKDVQGAIENFI